MDIICFNDLNVILEQDNKQAYDYRNLEKNYRVKFRVE